MPSSLNLLRCISVGLALGAASSWALAQTSVREPIRLRLQISSLNLDPSRMADIESRKVATLLHAGLVAVDLDGKVHPRLATGWERVDAQTWRFRLKPDVSFPDKRAVTAETVVWSLCSAMQAANLWSWSLASIEREPTSDPQVIKCTGLRVLDPLTVEIKEAQPTPWLFEALAGPGGWILEPGEAGKPVAYGNRPGIGPFTVERIEPDAEIILRARRDSGAALAPRVDEVRFRFIQDAGIAGRAFEQGALDVLEIDTPQLYDQLVNRDGERRQLKTPGELLAYPLSRIRTVIVNLNSLTARGFSPADAQAFRLSYASEVDRSKLARIAPGRATPLYSALPEPQTNGDGKRPQQQKAVGSIANLPAADLTLLTNNDSYSDLIAANLPSRTGPVTVRYRAVDFGSILNAILNGKFDLVCMSIDATIDAPAFWAAFWTPGAPFVAFGRALEGMVGLDLGSREQLERARDVIDREGNWVPLIKEEGLLAVRPRIIGISFTRSGQLDLGTIGLRER